MRASGVAVAGPAPGDFSVTLTVTPGDYTFSTSVVAGALGPSSEPCRANDLPLSVAAGVTPTTWLSGVSGTGAANGEFAAWRGSAAPIAGTWADDDQAQVALWQLQPGAEYGAWDGDLDIAVGAIDQTRGATWSAAAQGAYDARWRQSLQGLARAWEGRPGKLHIRFAHEFNGNWYPWSVDAADVADFRAAWARYRQLQQQYLPDALLVFSPNWESVSDTPYDWREAFPGADAVDLISIPYFGTETSASAFWSRALSVDPTGAPRGIQRHLEFAASVGLPFAVSEWGPMAAPGEPDPAAYVLQMAQFFRANAGPGPGRVRYEILFNVDRDDHAFTLMPTTNAPAAAEAYRRLW